MKNLAYEKALELGYNPLPYDKVVEILRKDSKIWVNKLSKYEKKAINKYTFNGIDHDSLKFYQKINGYLVNRYNLVDLNEEDMLLNNISSIENALLKNNLTEDIIVYRKDFNPELLEGINYKFISYSVTIYLGNYMFFLKNSHYISSTCYEIGFIYISIS